MKRHTWITLFILLAILLLDNTNACAQKKANKKNTNISLNIHSGKSDSLKTTYLNIGFITNIRQLRGMGINAFSSIVKTNAYGLQTSGLLSIAGHSMKGVQIGGLSAISGFRTSGVAISGLINISGYESAGTMFAGGINICGQNSYGLLFGGLFNISGAKMNGIAFSGLGNISRKDTKGVALSGLLNITERDLWGTQLSGLLNVNGRKGHGLQLSGIGNVSVNASGAQLSGLSNIVSDTLTGIQLAGLTNLCLKKMNGVQMALGNYATEVKGVQIGLLNLCAGHLKGAQIGLINHSKDTSTVKIGLVNVNPQTRIQMLAFGGNTTPFNMAARFRNKITYTLLGVGTHYLGLNKKFSGSLFYRAGLYYPLMRKLTISGDLGYAHIENFENKDEDTPKRMYSLQARINIEYQLWKKIGFFASGGYGMTRYYNQNKIFEKKPIVEVGIVLF